jgi:DNA-binding transcriptional regulator YiaG
LTVKKKKTKSKAKSNKKGYKAKQSTKEVGRPDTFRKKYIKQIHELAVIGYTDKKIAKFIGVSTSTLDTWKKKYPELLGCLHKARDGHMFEVIGTLYESAKGYSHADEKIGFDKNGKTLRAKTTKHYPPNVNAAIFLLTNRNPDEWKRERTIEDSPEEPTPVQVVINVVDKRKVDN